MVALCSRTCLGIVDARNVVHAAGDEEDAVGRPGEVVDLRAHGPAHVLDAPGFLVFEAFLKVGAVRGALGGDPQEDVSVVASRSQQLACWC